MSITAIQTLHPGRHAGTSEAGAVARGPQPRPVAVLIVDDDRDSSYALWALLRWQPGIRVNVSTSVDVIDVARRERPAVCLVSAVVGPRCVNRLAQLDVAMRVLVYTDRRSAELEGTAMIAGADGVVWRYGDGDELAHTIRRVAAGRGRPPELAPEAIQRLIDRVEDRDRPIAAMLLLRTAADEIARTLGISASSLQTRHAEIVRRLEGSFDPR